jgi:hypothetical protein
LDLDPLKRPTFERICEQLNLALKLGKKYEWTQWSQDKSLLTSFYCFEDIKHNSVYL